MCSLPPPPLPSGLKVVPACPLWTLGPLWDARDSSVISYGRLFVVRISEPHVFYLDRIFLFTAWPMLDKLWARAWQRVCWYENLMRIPVFPPGKIEGLMTKSIKQTSSRAYKFFLEGFIHNVKGEINWCQIG